MMADRYAQAADQVEQRIAELEGRKARFAAHPTLHTRVAGVQAEIDALRAQDVHNWRSTGKWASELWGQP